MILKRAPYIFLIIMFFAISVMTANQYDENTIKAIFIEKFTRFIEWPAGSDVYDKDQPFRLGVYGNTPMYEMIRKIYSQEKILGKNVKVIKLSKKNITGCDLVVISKNKKNEIDDLISIINGNPVLTIGESEVLAEQGTMIAYKIEDKRIRFVINQQKAIENDFKISHHLLNLAEVINPKTKK